MSEEYLLWRLFERFGMGIPTESRWDNLGEDLQVLGLAYEKIRESEEAEIVTSLMQAASLGGMKKKVK